MPRIALWQFTASDDPAVNLDHVRSGVAAARAEGARVVMFPEATMARFGTRLAALAEPLDGPWASEVAAIADRAGVVVIAGMFTPAEADRVYNTLLVTGQGQHTAYHKIHLYDAFGFFESRTVARGAQPLTVDVAGIRLGLATCYDVRFPELFQALADRGATAIAVPASWGAGQGKREQWELLVRARALDSGCWVAGCGQADPAASGIEVSGKAPTGIGHSLVADPFGRVHDSLDAGPGMLLVDIDDELAHSSRRATGVLANRVLGAQAGDGVAPRPGVTSDPSPDPAQEPSG
ncbi:carbon-nitrogen hydrolase family protein [Haloechinothrix sp. LS1_15]|uniref:carbon-nitrogen hydrolase family protein n=1 Tax=Haloechinothrix sp. LS1_15 TaxID=2652248 RepID=UPI002945A433|nr:carbon-nitrogen hydrolase family protein [Haloechinothrix sp. LS1_15]MDV6012695.1 carbon-nitrogen hydrolase family protein [Haloechinothrix sp. LS1_15]